MSKMIEKQAIQTNTANAKFLKNMVETASPEQLIIILYDGAIQWLKMAKQEIEKNKIEQMPNWANFSHYTKMTIQILEHLQDSLDHSAAQDFAERLFELYDFFKYKIMEASRKKETEKIDLVIEFLQDLRKDWKQAIKQLNGRALQ